MTCIREGDFGNDFQPIMFRKPAIFCLLPISENYEVAPLLDDFPCEGIEALSE